MRGPFIGTDLSTPSRDAVVSSLEADNPASPGVDLGHLHGEVVGLRARVHKSDHAKLLRQLLQYFLSGRHELIVQETGIGQKTGILGVEPHDVVGVAVADVGDVVDAVQHLVSVLFVEVLTLGVEQLERATRIGKSHHRVQGLPSLGDYRMHFFCIF